MKILAIEHEVGAYTAEDFRPYLQAEARRVWELYQTNHLREIYFHADEHCAVLMLECENVAAARELLHTLPLVQAGLITFEVIPLVPYDGWQRLFV